MKKFIYRIIIFLLMILLLIVFYETLSSIYISSNANFKLKSNPQYIVLGHSHPECAFNDSLINNFSNLAQSGESYFYTFQKVKCILKQNNSIKTIFIEFTNNQIDENMDNWIWGDKFMNYRYPLYASFMSVKDSKLLIKNNYKEFYNSFSISSKDKFLRILADDFDYIDEIGGYRYLRESKTDSILDKSNNLDETTLLIEDDEISELSILYLRKIIDLIKKHNIKIVLIRSPQHEKDVDFINEKIYLKILKSKFNDVEYIDFSRFPLENEDFRDLEHLNYKGAKKFSLWFDSLIKSGLIEKAINQQEIDEKLDAYRG